MLSDGSSASANATIVNCILGQASACPRFRRQPDQRRSRADAERQQPRLRQQQHRHRPARATALRRGGQREHRDRPAADGAAGQQRRTHTDDGALVGQPGPRSGGQQHRHYRRPAWRHPQRHRADLGAYEGTRPSATTFTVTIPGDTSGTAAGAQGSSGTSGDLRYCLNQAVQNQETDTIIFASALAGQTISLSSSLLTAPSGFANPYGQTAFIVGASDNITIEGSARLG